jgi:Transglycosylase SLT domain
MRGCAQSTLIALSVVQTVAVANAGERTTLTNPSVAMSGASSGQRVIKGTQPNISLTLDRVAYAVDGAESSHGEDLTMWRPDPSGPQGPMQVSGPAAADVGGGDRFDSTENRAIGRAYLAQLYRRYKNWPDAIAAYNWGMGNVDSWIKAGRPADKFVIGVAVYLRRVLHDSGMCDGSTAAPVRPPRARILPANQHPREVAVEEEEPEADSFALAVCADFEAWGGRLDERDRPFFGTQGHFYKKLEKAMLLVTQHLPASQRATHGRDDRAAVSWNVAMRRP